MTVEKKSYILITDVDDTVMGNDPSLARLRDFLRVHDPLLGIIYASGRFASSIRADVEHNGLPEPLAIIGGVGSEMEEYRSGKPITAWQETLAENWSVEDVRKALAGEEGLTDQPAECQSPFKVSYFLHNADEQRLAELQQRVEQAGVRASMIYSSHRDLDFLPAHADKGKAARFIADYLGYDAEHVFVSGNSGNDIKLFEHGFQGIVVGNADRQLKEAVCDPVYIAEAGYADGVREGLKYWLRIRGEM